MVMNAKHCLKYPCDLLLVHLKPAAHELPPATLPVGCGWRRTSTAATDRLMVSRHTMRTCVAKYRILSHLRCTYVYMCVCLWDVHHVNVVIYVRVMCARACVYAFVTVWSGHDRNFAGKVTIHARVDMHISRPIHVCLYKADTTIAFIKNSNKVSMNQYLYCLLYRHHHHQVPSSLRGVAVVMILHGSRS